ncbi:uncharacterized protein LOC143038872 isoform X4 [Oratosquilla oratoria]|uniref:uncharacterized protein LOC143038872 isoform X4 n=1 Tax=Oratosquilla oratoria TaxID=337810 RepID=UPI003F76A846
MLNCLLARQLCADAPACRSILELIPRVCGPENVACSTVTVNKCVAALRTLQVFPDFQPTCLCREPHLDRECNTFREFIFDHPCNFVVRKGSPQYPITALPTCDYAQRTCGQLPGCIQLYETFQEKCKVQQDQCRMEDGDACLKAWTELKTSPMFGCFCPNQKRKCLRIFDIVHHNPCVGQSSSLTPSKLPIPYSTCQSALKGCEADPACHRLLNPILNNCDNDQCNQKACMDSLQTFYRNVETKWAMEVAFCLCRKRGPTANECLTAQEKLHPACARKPTGPKPIPCNELAFDCKEDKSCRHRLEYYEQACAVDSDTKRCAGSCVECRRAVLGILGTKLRHICTCVNIASEPRDTYACLDWQKILWFNPCVHDSQTDLHRKSTPKPPAIIEVTTGFTTPYTTSFIPVMQGNGNPDPVRQPTHTSPTAPPRRITTTTTTAIPTTTLPPKYCVKEAVDYGKSDLIVEGGGKRYYTVDDQACSELCQCHKEEKLVCNVLNCVEARHCETTVAVYDHNAPTFKAGQGNCICYSGSFICVRSPDFNPDEELGYGIHLYLGFSSAEEALLNDYTHLTVDDAVKRLQKLVREREDKLNATSCNVETVRHVGENLILQATLPEFDELRDNMTASMYNEEKEKCVPALEEVSDLINDQAVDIRSDISLSMFILAEVRATVPDLPSSSTIPNPPSLLLLLLVTFCTMLLSDGGFKSSSSSTSTRRSTSNITITTTIPITNSSSSNNSNSSNSNTLKYWVVAS